LDREYLEDYEQKENEEFRRLVMKRIEKGKFDFKKDRYPPDNRFIKLHKPVAYIDDTKNIWAQIPFSGSLIIALTPVTRYDFERSYFQISDIPKVIDFIRETGKLQMVLAESPRWYQGLDFLDKIFEELKPPVIGYVPLSLYENEKEIQKAQETFHTLAHLKLIDVLQKDIIPRRPSRYFAYALEGMCATYTFLGVGSYSIVENIENLLADDPYQAIHLLDICNRFIEIPTLNLRYDLENFSLDKIGEVKSLPLIYQPKEIRFPCEIGKFLLKKLTYAAQDMRACYYLMDNYDAYDLQKVQSSLNEAIVTNHPEIVNKSAKELSEILDNVWNDKTIPRRVKGLQIGIPLSMAAIGCVAAGPVGATGGFLAGLGYSVADKFIDLETEGLSERIAKLKTKSYQANIYDFEQKYKAKIVQ